MLWQNILNYIIHNMKIVHTFINTKNGSDFNEYTAYCMLLSVLLAKKHYDKVELYCNDEISQIVKEIGIPYTSINTELLNGVTVDTFAIPKLIVYANQDEPFLHIDLDTFLFDKLPELDRNTVWGCYAEGSGEYVSYTKNGTNFYTTYIQGAFKIQNDVPEEFLEFVKFRDIMNMCVFGGYNTDAIKQATKYCLDIYENNKQFFDSDYYNSCIIEQLFIPAAVRMFSRPRRPDRELFSFFFNDNPTWIRSSGEGLTYPLLFENNEKKLFVANKMDIFRNISYNFNGFLHLNGYKTYEEIMFIIKQKLIQDFDMINEVIKIDSKFNEVGNCSKMSNDYLIYLNKQIENLNNVKNKNFKVI